MLFIVGVAVFLAVNVVMYIISHPTIPNPGPLSDIRKEVYAIFAVLVLIALLGQAGRWFSAGFVSGLLGMTLPNAVMSPSPVTNGWVLLLATYSEQWLMPEGTAAHEAAIAARLPEQQERASQRAELRYLAERRKLGLDEATGTNDLLTAQMCVTKYYDQHGEYPRERGNSPGSEVCEGVYNQIHNGWEGWEIAYQPIPDSKGHVTRYHLRSGPDSRLGFDGPWLETDEQGVVMKRAHTGEPAHGISPMIGTLAWIVWCIDRNREAYAARGNPSATLDDMIFHSKVICAGLAPLQHSDSDPYAQTNPNDLLYLLDAPTTQKIKTVAVYTFSYVPRGFTLAEGYDLYLIPHKGESGIRSYLRAADGSVHVTTESRRATLQDPLALPCELHGNEVCSS